MSYVYLFLLNAVLRIPSFLNPFTSDDEAIYASMAEVVLNGGTYFVDTVDHKPPLTVWLYAVLFNLFGEYNMAAIHVALVLWVFLTSWVIGQIAQSFAGRASAFWAMLLYIIFSTTMRDYDALAANNELWMNLPICLSALALLRGRYLLAGMAIASAILFKYQALFAAMAFFSFLLLDKPFRSALLFFLGSFIVGMGFVAVILMQGSWSEFWFWGVQFNWDYIGQGLHGSEMFMRLLRRSLETVLPAILPWGIGILAVVKFRSKFLSLWLLMSLVAILLGGRFFGHYFLQPLVPLCVLAALLLPQLWKSDSRRWRHLFILSALIVPMAIFLTLSLRRSQMLRVVGETEPDYRTVGLRVQEITKPEDSIFVWSNSPQIYYYSRRVAGTRFSFCNYQTGQTPATPAEFDIAVDADPYIIQPAWDMLMEDLKKNRPVLFIDATHGGFDDFGKAAIEKFPRLQRLLTEQYTLVETVKGVRLFRLRI